MTRARSHRFSKNVFAFTMFLPMAAPFQAKYEPYGKINIYGPSDTPTDGSTW